MAEIKLDNNILTIVGVAILGILLFKFFKQSNEESWKVERDESGKIKGLTIKREIGTKIPSKK